MEIPPQDPIRRRSRKRTITKVSQLPYALNNAIRHLAINAVRRFQSARDIRSADLRQEKISKILLVRTNFRMGNSILAIPGILLFRKFFPRAQIDFVGSPVSQVLFQNLPIDRHYRVARRFPESTWSYPVLIKQLQAAKYDLAVELSCSQSALGAFIVASSGARLKVGRAGKWDFCFNIKVPKSKERNKYRALPAFVASMGFDVENSFPALLLSAAERAQGREALDKITGGRRSPMVGVFVGGRKRFGKRWPAGDFLKLVQDLTTAGLAVAVFFGPEEMELIKSFAAQLGPDVALVGARPLREFAAMVSHCHLFVTADSGPMHLACALGVRTVAIFQNPDAGRWGPPPHAARILYSPSGTSPSEVKSACLAELERLGQTAAAHENVSEKQP